MLREHANEAVTTLCSRIMTMRHHDAPLDVDIIHHSFSAARRPPNQKLESPQKQLNAIRDSLRIIVYRLCLGNVGVGSWVFGDVWGCLGMFGDVWGLTDMVRSLYSFAPRFRSACIQLHFEEVIFAINFDGDRVFPNKLSISFHCL